MHLTLRSAGKARGSCLSYRSSDEIAVHFSLVVFTPHQEAYCWSSLLNKNVDRKA